MTRRPLPSTPTATPISHTPLVRCLAQVLDEDLLYAEQLCPASRRLHLLALAVIRGEGHDLAVIGSLQPAQDDGCIEAAGIGEDDFFDLVGHGRATPWMNGGGV